MLLPLIYMIPAEDGERSVLDLPSDIKAGSLTSSFITGQGPALQGLRLVVDVHDEENMGQALQEAQQTRGATAKTWSNGELDSGSTVC